MNPQQRAITQLIRERRHWTSGCWDSWVSWVRLIKKQHKEAGRLFPRGSLEAARLHLCLVKFWKALENAMTQQSNSKLRCGVPCNAGRLRLSRPCRKLWSLTLKTQKHDIRQSPKQSRGEGNVCTWPPPTWILNIKASKQNIRVSQGLGTSLGQRDSLEAWSLYGSESQSLAIRWQFKMGLLTATNISCWLRNMTDYQNEPSYQIRIQVRQFRWMGGSDEEQLG